MVSSNPALALAAGVLLATLGGCVGWLPDSATRENHASLYNEFYEAHLNEDDERAELIAARLDLCGRQLFVKRNGLLTALCLQREYEGEPTFGGIYDLFTADACGSGRMPAMDMVVEPAVAPR
jgi:hypothetical protein